MRQFQAESVFCEYSCSVQVHSPAASVLKPTEEEQAHMFKKKKKSVELKV